MTDDQIPPLDVGAVSEPRALVERFMAPHVGRTRENHSYYLRWWLTWSDATGVDPIAATRTDIKRWLRYLHHDRGLTPNTARSHLTGVSSFYRWLGEVEYLEADPMRYVRRPRAPRRSGRIWLPRQELVDLLDAARLHPDPSASAAVLLALGGVRVGEASRLDVSHIGRHGDPITAYLRERKDGGSDTISLPTVSADAVLAAVDGRRHGPVLRTAIGTRMRTDTISSRLRTISTSAGIARVVTQHDLRASFVTFSLEAGVADADVMSSVGHSSCAATAYYDRTRGTIDRHAGHRLAAWLDSY